MGTTYLRVMALAQITYLRMNPTSAVSPAVGAAGQVHVGQLGFVGGPPGSRTPHQKLKRLLLYRMS